MGEPTIISFGGREPSESPEGGARRPLRVPLAAVTLVIGAIGGYLIGHQHTGTATPAPKPSPTFRGDALVSTGHTCSRLITPDSGRAELQLGVEVVNRSPSPITLFRTASLNLPLDGVAPVDPAAIGTCGQTAGGSLPQQLTLPPSGTTWYSVVVRPTSDGCPWSYPVRFVVSFTDGQTVTPINVGGFNDLGQISYPGCPDPDVIATG